MVFRAALVTARISTARIDTASREPKLKMSVMAMEKRRRRSPSRRASSSFFAAGDCGSAMDAPVMRRQAVSLSNARPAVIRRRTFGMTLIQLTI